MSADVSGNKEKFIACGLTIEQNAYFACRRDRKGEKDRGGGLCPEREWTNLIKTITITNIITEAVITTVTITEAVITITVIITATMETTETEDREHRGPEREMIRRSRISFC